MKFYVFLIIFFVVGGSIVYSLSNYAHPSDDDLDLEILSLKSENDLVSKFYDTFDTVSVVPIHYDRYDKDTGKSTGGKWRIAFDSQHAGQIHQLQIFYFAWEPFGATYLCFDSLTNMTKIYSDSNIVSNMKYDC